MQENTPDRTGIAAYGQALRSGARSAEETTAEYLRRIATDDAKLGAYTFVAHEQAMATARAMDALLRAGTDLGPLMGVPVAVKDLYYVTGMPPPTAGSRLDVSDVVREEGAFVRALRRCGCVILGKTWTSEFALGGINFVQRVPWNPCDRHIHRTPGGSSGGSAVAMAAGLCAFAIGSDTGGSVRMPAALCGSFGHKFSSRAFPLAGIFPLSPTLDSIGTFTASAADATTIWTALAGAPDVPAARLRGLRLVRPKQLYFDDLDQAVALRIDRALASLERAGAEVVAEDFPEIAEFEQVFGSIVPIELIGILGRERIERGMSAPGRSHALSPEAPSAEGSPVGVFDPVVQARFAAAIDQSAAQYVGARTRLDELRAAVARRSAQYDAWVTPTTPLLASALAEHASLDAALAWNRRALRNTRPGNIFDQCGVSIPLGGGGLPVGLQLSCPAMQDTRLLAIARAVEAALEP